MVNPINVFGLYDNVTENRIVAINQALRDLISVNGQEISKRLDAHKDENYRYWVNTIILKLKIMN